MLFLSIRNVLTCILCSHDRILDTFSFCQLFSINRKSHILIALISVQIFAYLYSSFVSGFSRNSQHSNTIYYGCISS